MTDHLSVQSRESSRSSVPRGWVLDYAPGEWLVFAAAQTLVAMRPSAEFTSQLVATLWSELEQGANQDEVRNALSRHGVDGHVGLVVLTAYGQGAHCLVRGEVQVRQQGRTGLLADGARHIGVVEAHASGGTLLLHFGPDPLSDYDTAPPTDSGWGGGAVPHLPLEAGVALCSSLMVQLSELTASALAPGALPGQGPEAAGHGLESGRAAAPPVTDHSFYDAPPVVSAGVMDAVIPAEAAETVAAIGETAESLSDSAGAGTVLDTDSVGELPVDSAGATVPSPDSAAGSVAGETAAEGPAGVPPAHHRDWSSASPDVLRRIATPVVPPLTPAVVPATEAPSQTLADGELPALGSSPSDPASGAHPEDEVSYTVQLPADDAGAATTAGEPEAAQPKLGEPVPDEPAQAWSSDAEADPGNLPPEPAAPGSSLEHLLRFFSPDSEQQDEPEASGDEQPQNSDDGVSDEGASGSRAFDDRAAAGKEPEELPGGVPGHGDDAPRSEAREPAPTPLDQVVESPHGWTDESSRVFFDQPVARDAFMYERTEVLAPRQEDPTSSGEEQPVDEQSQVSQQQSAVPEAPQPPETSAAPDVREGMPMGQPVEPAASSAPSQLEQPVSAPEPQNSVAESSLWSEPAPQNTPSLENLAQGLAQPTASPVQADSADVEPIVSPAADQPDLSSEDNPGGGLPVVSGEPVSGGESETPAQEAPLAILVTTNGEVYRLDGAILIGRAPRPEPGDDATILRVPSPHHDISRTHVRVAPHEWDIAVTDMNSTNGTIVFEVGNDPIRLGAGETLLVGPGTVIDLGDGQQISIERAR